MKSKPRVGYVATNLEAPRPHMAAIWQDGTCPHDGSPRVRDTPQEALSAWAPRQREYFHIWAVLGDKLLWEVENPEKRVNSPTTPTEKP